MGKQAGTVVLTNTYWGSLKSGTRPQNIPEWFWQIHIRAPKDQAQRHKVGILNFVNGTHGQAHRHSGCVANTNWVSPDKTQHHKIDIVDFVNGSHGQAHRHTGLANTY